MPVTTELSDKWVRAYGDTAAWLSTISNSSLCPYKGVTDHYWHLAGQPDAKNIAGSYAAPFPAVGKIAGRIAFHNELVDITADGVRLERPLSAFSQSGNRPGS